MVEIGFDHVGQQHGGLTMSVAGEHRPAACLRHVDT